MSSLIRLDVQMVTGHTVPASVAWGWAEASAGDWARRWPVVESVQATETVWDECCHDEPEPVAVEGQELVNTLPRHELRRLESLIEERA